MAKTEKQIVQITVVKSADLGWVYYLCTEEGDLQWCIPGGDFSLSEWKREYLEEHNLKTRDVRFTYFSRNGTDTFMQSPFSMMYATMNGIDPTNPFFCKRASTEQVEKIIDTILTGTL